jgi:V8-like Glu-specific endopeptidase
MSITFSHHTGTVVAVVAGIAIVVGVHLLAPQADAGTGGGHPAGRPANAAVQQDSTSTVAQAATIRYWTTDRMAAALRAVKESAAPRRSLVKKAVAGSAARPKPNQAEPWLMGNTAGHGFRWTRGGAAADAVGKIFFTLDGEDYACSGTLVGGRHADVVLTAAHCVTSGSRRDGAPDWATNWMFVPGYRDGQMPYGEYTARQFFVAKDWTGPGGNEQYDVAFVRIAGGTLHGGSGTASPPPVLPVAFTDRQDAAPASRAYVFGYPSLLPYTGLYTNYCAGQVAASHGSERMACGMTAGDSGGPWLAGFNPLTGHGTVVAVSTYKVSDDLSVLYGAVLGPQARALYQRAVSPTR